MRRTFLMILFFALFIVPVFSASADVSVCDLYINDSNSTHPSALIFSEDAFYMDSDKISSYFNITTSIDYGNKIYNFSSCLRNVTYDSSTGSTNIIDRNSFLYEIIEDRYKSFLYNDKLFIPLDMLCESFGYRYDFINENNSVVIYNTKDDIGLFNSQNIAVAYRGNKYGLVNRNGDIVLKFKYDSISNFDNPEIYKVTSNHRCGLVNFKGDFIADPVYTEIIYESPSVIYLDKDGLKGVCDINGYIIVPTVFDDVQYCDNNFAMVKEGNYWHLYNCLTDYMYEQKYDEVYKISAGIQTDNFMIKGFYVMKDGKWGCVDSFGNTVIELKYDALDKFDINGRARVIHGNKFGIVDCGGRVIIPPAFDYLDSFGALNITVAQLGNKYGILKSDFSILTAFEYDYIYPFNDKQSTVAYKDGKYGIISSECEILADFKYIHMEDFVDGLSLAHNGVGYGYVDHRGNEIIDCVHDDVKQGTSLSVFLKKDDKWALFSKNGENLTGFCYSNAANFSNGLSAVSLPTTYGNSFGYVNDSGDVIIPFVYTSALDFKYGKAIVSKGKYSGIIDIENNTLIPFVYTGFNPSYDYGVIAAANESGKWGLISLSNEKLSEFKYDYIFEFENNYALTLKNGKYGVIHSSGKIIYDTVFDSQIKAQKKIDSIIK